MFAPKLRAKAVANPRDGIGHARSMLPVNHSGNRSIEETQWLRHSNGHQATSGPVAVHDRNQRSGQPGQENFDAFPPAARALRNFAGIPVFSPRQDGPFDSRSSVPTFFMPGAMQNERRTSRMLRDMRGDGSDDVMLTDQHDGGSPTPGSGASGSGASGSGAGSGGSDAGSAAASVRPVAVRNGPFHAPIDTATTAGMEIAITLTSSSGVDADMAAVQDSEQVGLSYNHTGSFSGMTPLPSNQSGFMAGFPIPNDQHGTPKSLIIDRADNHGGGGQFDKDQLDIFTASGVPTATAIPASGYRIRRIIKTGPGTKIVLRTEKSAHACTVNGFNTTAGPSPTQADEVVVRG
jgi:hypothetical protein